MHSKIYKSFSLITVLYILIFNTQAQQQTNQQLIPTYEASALNKDFEIFKGALKAYHPALNWYTSPNELNHLIDSVATTLSIPLNELEFYTKLATIISRVRCGHTRVRPSNITYYKLINQGKFFPLDLKFIQGKAYCYQNRSNDTLSIQPGNEVLKINGIDIDSIVSLAINKESGDGYTKTKKLSMLECYFREFYPFHIGLTETFEVQYINNDGRKKVLILDAVPLSELKPRKKNNKKSLKSNLTLNMTDIYSTAVLTVKEFANWEINGKKIKFKKELAKLFDQINTSGIKNLIIDLRNNGGGNDNFGLNLFSYFYDQPVAEFKSMEYKIKKSEYFTYSDINAFQLFLMSRVIFKTGKLNDSIRYVKGLKTLKPHSPSLPSFKGKVYILINGRSFSTTADFSALMKSYGLAAFIGEETGGGYYGNSSAVSISVTLPNTGINLKIPTIKYTTNVKPILPKGSGIIPDYKVVTSINDYLKGIDPQMNLATKLILENE